MTDEKADDTALIAKYKAESISRRGRSKTKANAEEASLAVKARNGVFKVHFARGAKPMYGLGGVSKVLGLSQISIPEFKLRRD